MKRTLLLTVALSAAACDRAGFEATTMAAEPFPFEGRAEIIPHLDSEEAEYLARSVLAPGETLGWFGTIVLAGMGDTYVLAAAHRDDDPSSSRGFAVSSTGESMDSTELRYSELERVHDRFGKLDAALFDKQELLEDGALIDISIIVTGDWSEYAPPTQSESQVTAAESTEYVSAHRAMQRERLNQAKVPVRALLADAGLEESSTLDGVPAVTVRAPVWFLRSRQLNEFESVTRVFATSNGQDTQLLGYAGEASMHEASLTGGLCDGDCSGAGVISVGLWEYTDEDNLNMTSSYGTIASNNTRFYSQNDIDAVVPRLAVLLTVTHTLAQISIASAGQLGNVA